MTYAFSGSSVEPLKLCGSANRIGVLIADRHDLTRLGMLAVIGDARSDWSGHGAAGMEELRGKAPLASLLVVDLNLPGLDGIAGIRRLHAEYPDRTLIVLSEADDRETVLACLTAGAQGYILKSANAAQILRAIDTVLEGGIHAPASLTMINPHSPARRSMIEDGTEAALTQLTDRQRDVFRLLQEGCATKTIARRLDLAVGTVKVHLAAIYRALGVRGRLEALAIVHRAGHHAMA